jgi:hypothetical protein
MIVVRLTFRELQDAGYRGVDRQVYNVMGRTQPRYGASKKNAWEKNIEGTQGEKAVAKHYGIPWDGALGDYKAQDVGPLQVRATRRPDGCLLLHPEDDDADCFILAIIVSDGVVRLAGAISGRDGKRPQFWREGIERPAYFVPQSALGSLPFIIEYSTS